MKITPKWSLKRTTYEQKGRSYVPEISYREMWLVESDRRLHAYIAYMLTSWVHVSRLKNTSVVFRFLHLVAGADDADCCLLLLEKLVDLARAVYG